jgi:cytochrome oxidase assembly protein ShyY1
MIRSLLLITFILLVRDNGQYKNIDPDIKSWIKSLTDKKGNNCCDTADGYPAEVEYDIEKDNYKVRIEGEWHIVPNEALIIKPNRLGYAVVWYTYKDGIPKIRCFLPGAGG